MKALNLKIGNYEIKVKVRKPNLGHSTYNQKDTEYFLNHIVIALQEAANNNRENIMGKIYDEQAKDIYNFLNELGAYDDVREEVEKC